MKLNILKIFGVIETDNLGAILIFETDFNFANKLYLGSRLMKRAKISWFITQEQHGGRSWHMAIEAAVPRSLIFDYVIKTRRNASLVSYVAEGWYECVSHNFVSLTDNYFDIPLTSTIYCLKATQ